MDSCHVNVAGGSENTYGKVNILLQTYVSQGRVDNFSLVSDQAYVAQVILLTIYSYSCFTGLLYTEPTVYMLIIESIHIN